MKAEGFPIPDYDQLTFPQIMRRLSGLSPQELKLVYKREQAGPARPGVLARLELALGDDFEAILASEEPAATGGAAPGQDAASAEPVKSALKVMRPAARAAAERMAAERAGVSAKPDDGGPARWASTAGATAGGAMTTMRPAARAAAAKAAAERAASKR